MLEPIQRFLDKIIVSEDGCWNWTAQISTLGYGVFSIKTHPLLSHRFIFEYYYGEILEKLEVHHVCENKKCVNPNHLKQLSVKQHNQEHRKIHCPQGHEYNIENTYVTIEGWRQCRICHKVREQIRRC